MTNHAGANEATGRHSLRSGFRPGGRTHSARASSQPRRPDPESLLGVVVGAAPAGRRRVTDAFEDLAQTRDREADHAIRGPVVDPQLVHGSVGDPTAWKYDAAHIADHLIGRRGR